MTYYVQVPSPLPFVETWLSTISQTGHSMGSPCLNWVKRTSPTGNPYTNPSISRGLHLRLAPSSQAPQMLGEGMGSRGEGPTYSVLGRPGSWLLPGCPPALLGAGRRCLAPVPPPHWLCPPVGKPKGQCSPGPRDNGKASRFLGRARGKPTALRRESEGVRQGQQQ